MFTELLIVPAGQIEHEADPDELECDPAGHGVHIDCPALAYVPARHTKHDVYTQ